MTAKIEQESQTRCLVDKEIMKFTIIPLSPFSNWGCQTKSSFLSISGIEESLSIQKTYFIYKSCWVAPVILLECATRVTISSIKLQKRNRKLMHVHKEKCPLSTMYYDLQF